MKISYAHKFKIREIAIVDFIATNSPARARKFHSDLKEQIKKIVNMPYKHRKSTMANDEQIRELVFKKYVIPFLIDEENEAIDILSIYGRNLP